MNGLTRNRPSSCSSQTLTKRKSQKYCISKQSSLQESSHSPRQQNYHLNSHQNSFNLHNNSNYDQKLMFDEMQSLSSHISTSKGTITSKMTQNNSASALSASCYRTSSAIRKKQLSNEFQFLKDSIASVYKSYRKKKKPDVLTARYLQWTGWLKKKSPVSPTVKLTKREFEKLWLWFKSHMDESDVDEEGGIHVDKIVDAFVDYGVFQTKTQAVKLVRSLDTDGNQTITFTEFMEGINHGELTQILQLRCFVSTLARERPKQKKPLLKLFSNAVLKTRLLIRASSSFQVESASVPSTTTVAAFSPRDISPEIVATSSRKHNNHHPFTTSSSSSSSASSSQHHPPVHPSHHSHSNHPHQHQHPSHSHSHSNSQTHKHDSNDVISKVLTSTSHDFSPEEEESHSQHHHHHHHQQNNHNNSNHQQNNQHNQQGKKKIAFITQPATVISIKPASTQSPSHSQLLSTSKGSNKIHVEI